ncbi:MAG: hypothetical protein CL973_04585 [Euryarchaeota archaeon]|nr:hypothetical protein [Euryarchaeota archaeon]
MEDIMKIAIIGSGIEVFTCGHRLLDKNPNLEIHIFDKKAESGMYGEEPGLFDEWPLTPINWVGSLFSQQPKENSTAIRYSWFVKALSISLAKRGANFHLKSVVKNIENGIIDFSGAGYLASGQMKFDDIIDFREYNSDKVWYGGVMISNPKVEIFGIRPDQTIEVWSQEEKIEGNYIQKMEWRGNNPRYALIDRVNKGIEAAESIISE